MSRYEYYQSIRQFPSLDGLRCISILMVIWHHTRIEVSFLPMTSRGYLGVDIFFVISGFLIVALLLREKRATKHINLKDFYIRRTLRIFPIYYLVLALATFYFFVIKPQAKSAPEFFEMLPYYATYTSNWVQGGLFFLFWSLATEEQFYLGWSSVERFIPTKSMTFLLISLIFVNQLVNFMGLTAIFGEKAAPFDQLQIVLCTFTPILFGVSLAHLLDEKKSFDWIARFLEGYWSTLIPFLLFLIFINIPGDVQGYKRMMIQFSTALFIAGAVINSDQIFASFLNHPIIKRIGVVSYGMYIYHILVVYALQHFYNRVNIPLLPFFMTFVMTYLIAEISYRFFEQPFLSLKKRFTPRRKE